MTLECKNTKLWPIAVRITISLPWRGRVNKPSTFLVIIYFPTYLLHGTYFLQNQLLWWNEILTQLRFIHNWVWSNGQPVDGDLVGADSLSWNDLQAKYFTVQHTYMQGYILLWIQNYNSYLVYYHIPRMVRH